MFNLDTLLLSILSTVIPFFWVFKLKEFNAKAYFGIIVFFFFIYSGVGGAHKEINEHYWYYYLIYTVFLSFGIYLSRGNNKTVGKEKTGLKLTEFIDKYGNIFIVLYIILNLAKLIYPQFILYRIIIPPAPNLTDLFDARLDTVSITLYESLLYYAVELIKPFFYFSIFKYRKKPIIFLLLIIAEPYIGYCKISYMGRGSMIMFLFIYVATIFKWIPNLRKPIIISMAFFAPILAVFLLNYASVRIGGAGVDTNNWKAIEEVFFQETAFPLWFSKIYNSPFEYNNFKEYILWILTLPIPGFLKGDTWIGGDKIASLLLGIKPYQSGFNIVLPGLVGESVFYFGNYFFFIHAFLYGTIIGKVFNFLRRHVQFDIIMFYVAFELSYMVNRGGTGSAYPFIFKHLLIFFVVIFIYSRYKISIYGKSKTWK